MARATIQEKAWLASAANAHAETTCAAVMRIKSQDLLQQAREIEIDHEGRIYRLRLTHLNKLILTA